MCSVLQIRSVAVPTVTANISKKKEKLEFRTLVCLSESSGGAPKLSRETQNGKSRTTKVILKGYPWTPLSKFTPPETIKR